MRGVGFVNRAGGAGGGAPPPSLLTNFAYDHTAQSGALSQSSYTFNTQGIGTAAGDRWVLVCTQAFNTSNPANAVTVGGVSGSKVYDESLSSNKIGFWVANVPSGTTATILVGFATSESRNCVIDVYTFNGTPSTTPSATQQFNGFGSDQTLTLAMKNGGIAVAIFEGASSGVTFATTTPAWTADQTDQNTGAAHTVRHISSSSDHTQDIGTIHYTSNRAFAACAIKPA